MTEHFVFFSLECGHTIHVDAGQSGTVVEVVVVVAAAAGATVAVVVGDVAGWVHTRLVGVVVGFVVDFFLEDEFVDVVADVNALEVGTVSVDGVEVFEVVGEAVGGGCIF